MQRSTLSQIQGFIFSIYFDANVTSAGDLFNLQLESFHSSLEWFCLAGVNESPQWDPGSPRTPQSSAGSQRVSEASGPAPGCVQDGVRYFSVVWCKASKKKHKRWEGDAVLVTRGRSVVLKDMEGKNIGTGEA